MQKEIKIIGVYFSSPFNFKGKAVPLMETYNHDLRWHKKWNKIELNRAYQGNVCIRKVASFWWLFIDQLIIIYCYFIILRKPIDKKFTWYNFSETLIAAYYL